MVELAEIQAAYYMVAATGVLVAAIYYIYHIRVAQRNMKQTIETRQAQFFMQIYQQIKGEDSQRRWIDVMNMEWRDYDDYEKKYGSDEHPDMYVKRSSALYELNGVGYLLKSGVIDRDTAYSLTEVTGLWLWRKFEPIVREQRVRYNIPEIYADLEYLAAEIVKELEERGHSSKVPEKFAQYTGTNPP